jgi:hypothetical protein
MGQDIHRDLHVIDPLDQRPKQALNPIHVHCQPLMKALKEILA